MNRIIRAGVAMAAAASIGGTAFAATYKITPEGGSTASGPSTLVKGSTSLSCTTTLVGTVTNGVANVTKATFSGSSGACSFVTAANLPWKIYADSLTTGHGNGIAVNTPIGNCSATNNVPGTYNNSTHQLKFTNATLNGGCKITGTLTTTNKPLTIVQASK